MKLIFRCEHCKNMMSTWDALSNEYAKQDKQIDIVKVRIVWICEIMTIYGKSGVLKNSGFYSKASSFFQVDCTEDTPLCVKQNIKAYPT